MPFKASGRGAYGPQGQKVIKGPLAPVWVTSGSVASQNIGTSLNVQLSATDDSGDAPTYTLATGSLPSGISLSSSGLLSGTIGGSAGTFTFTVNATDVNGRTTTSSNISITTIQPYTPFGAVYTSSTSVALGSGNYRVATVGGGAGGRTGHDGGAGSGFLAYQQVGSVGATTWTISVGAGGNGGPQNNSGANGNVGGNSSVTVNGTTYASASGSNYSSGWSSNGGGGGFSGGGSGGNSGGGGSGGSGGNNGGGSTSSGGPGQGTGYYNAWIANLQYPSTNFGFTAGAGGNGTGGSHCGGGGGGGINGNSGTPGQTGSSLGGSSGAGFGGGGVGGGYNGTYYAGGTGRNGMVYVWNYA